MANNDRPRAERDKPGLVIGSRYITAYDPGLALEVCEKIAEGKKLKDVLTLPGYPVRSTWYRWCMLYPDLKIMYETARQISAEGQEESLLEVAEDLLNSEGKLGLTAIQLDRIKTGLAQIRWSAARRDPAKFAERPQVNTVIPVQINTTLNMGQSGVAAVQGSIYAMLAQRPAQPEGVVDAEFEQISGPSEGETALEEGTGGDGAGLQRDRQLPSRLPVGDAVPRPAIAKRPYPQRLRKGHKTPQQTRATMGAYSQRGKPKGKKNVATEPSGGDGAGA